jgi:hypothetical protein
MRLTSPPASSDSLADLVALMPSPPAARRWQAYVQRHLGSFRQALGELSLPPGQGSISTAEAFWLFRLVSELQPAVVIDSGSATGWSAFVMAAAAPGARIHCFDPYRRPEALPPYAKYYATDWTKTRIALAPNTFALFDDHVNQRLRVLQAQRAGLTDAVFHDVYGSSTKSTVSLAFADLLGLLERIYTFEPLWFADPMFMDTTTNPQMYRWLTWVQLLPRSRFRVTPRLLSAAQRRFVRNPAADKPSQLNWRARS